MAKEKNLIEQYNKYMKRGKIDEFINYLQENDLIQEFIKSTYYSLFMKSFNNTKEQEDAINLTNFILKISSDKLTSIYGEKLANRFMKIIYNTPYPSKRMVDICSLTQLREETLTEMEASEIEKIMDLTDNKDVIVGTQVTGHEIGEKIFKDGIILTGHKFVTPNENNYKKNIKETLKDNITFFENDTIGLASQIIKSRGYNHYGNDKYNDVMIVVIPKEELEEDKEGIIIQDDFETSLNPKYIKGFVRVDAEKGYIEGCHDNPLFANEKTEFNSVQDLTSADWEKMFRTWYESCKGTKIQKMKANITGFFKKILDKDKNREDNIEK